MSTETPKEIIEKLEQLVREVDGLIYNIKASNAPGAIMDKVPLLDFYKEDLVRAIEKMKGKQ